MAVAALQSKPETHKLLVQSNGWIVLETRGDRFVRTGPARDLRYHIEYKSVRGWHPIHSTFEDDITVRQILREHQERSPRIQWRLVASNEHGSVALPKEWRA